ncbi:hypothetical protein [Akkermansia muciniphila]|jgi:hypothetical protein|nr:hypothetical protein [Akkermansia muciniphila]
MKRQRRIPLSFSGTTQLPPAKRSTWAVELHLRHYEEFGMEFIQ